MDNLIIFQENDEISVFDMDIVSRLAAKWFLVDGGCEH
jgi:hypothetical protein